MFGDLDWPLNASRVFVSIRWASCCRRHLDKLYRQRWTSTNHSKRYKCHPFA